jgi:hypothetical protein
MQAPLLTRRATLATLWGGAVVGWGVACNGALGADIVISPKGLALERFLDGLDVDRRWIAGVHIDWETGIPDGKPEKLPGKHTHCSAFVASAAKKLGIYILRPPEHGQVLLANAQFEWLEGEQGRVNGWRPIADGIAEQAAANEGDLAVATYHNKHDDKPGHIAIIRPGTKTAQAIAAEGPNVIQAGGTNYMSTNLKQGFAGHPGAFARNEIKYYTHAIDVPLG